MDPGIFVHKDKGVGPPNSPGGAISCTAEEEKSTTEKAAGFLNETAGASTRKSAHERMGVRRKLVFTFVRHGETEENANKILQGSKHTSLNETGREQAGRLGVRLHKEHAHKMKSSMSSSSSRTAPTTSAQEPPFHFIFSSDNPRAYETAEHVTKQFLSDGGSPSSPWGQVVETPLLTERKLGVYEGRSSEHVLNEFGRLRWDNLPEPRMLSLWDIIAEENSYDQTGVESKLDFLNRAQMALQFMIAHIVSFLARYVSRNAVPEIRVLCVSHAMFIRALLTQLLNVGTEWIMNVGTRVKGGIGQRWPRWFACDIRNASVTRVQTELVIYETKRGDQEQPVEKMSLKKKVRLMNPFLLCLNDSSHCFEFYAMTNA